VSKWSETQTKAMSPQEQMNFHEKERNALRLIPSLLKQSRKIHLFSVNSSDINNKMHQSLSMSEYLRLHHKNTSNRWQQRVL
jgi:hypothetical protein